MVTAIAMNDVEAELSYAYLHAVAAMAGATCSSSGRLPDNRGIDAQLTAWGPFPSGGERLEVDLKIQLKATIAEPTDTGSHFSYTFRDITGYNDLRKNGAYAIPRILVVLYLPKDALDWLSSSDDVMSIKRGAYWVSLAGAEETKNKAAVTVYLPKSQLLTADSLKSLFARLSHGAIPQYIKPESIR